MYGLRTLAVVFSVISLFAEVSMPLGVCADAARELQGMVGDWSCVDRDSDAVVTRFTNRAKIYGDWLRLDSSFAAEPRHAPVTGITFLGRDAARQRWIITAVIETGEYWVRSSPSKHLDGSRWVDAYPADGATAVLRLPQPGRRWTFQLTQASGSKAFESNVTCDRI